MYIILTNLTLVLCSSTFTKPAIGRGLGKVCVHVPPGRGIEKDKAIVNAILLYNKIINYNNIIMGPTPIQ